MNDSQPLNGTASPFAVELCGVSHHYGVRPVLRDINLAIPPGQRMVIVGPNGMGKTTLLGLMAGILHPLHGTVSVHGLVRRSSEEAELTIRRQTVYLPDQAFLPKLRTGREWLLGIGRVYEIDIDRLIDHVDPVQYSIRLLVPPGSLLLGSPAMQPYLGPLVESSLSYAWSHPDPRMDELQRRSAERVARATAMKEPPEITYLDLKALAFAIADRPRPFVPVRFPTEGAPKLSESWFC